jgi:hypothetical protein
MQRHAMCEECTEIDRRIEHLKHLASRITDQQMLDGVDQLVAELKARKVVLHTEQKP